MLTPLDESFGHQVVAPRAVVEHPSPNWAERCYHLLHPAPDITLSVGRALHPVSRRRTAFAGLAEGTVQHVLRVEEDVADGDDPDRPAVGPLTIEVLEPLSMVRLALDDRNHGIGFDLTYRYRIEPVLTDRNRIEIDGVVVTDYMNFFASGHYAGSITVGDRTVDVDAHGFRDRGWGLRKHEGAPHRGFVMGMFAEFDDHAVYALLYETGSGRRAMSNGWRLRPGQAPQRTTEIVHDLDLHDGLLWGGTVCLIIDGEQIEVQFVVENRLFLSPLGYAPGEPPGEVGVVTTFDQSDSTVRAELAGQTDHGIRAVSGGQVGTGYVEVGLGQHPRYSPEGDTFLTPRRSER